MRGPPNRSAADVYARRLDVLNRGLSGYNTDWAALVFDEVGAVSFC